MKANISFFIAMSCMITATVFTITPLKDISIQLLFAMLAICQLIMYAIEQIREHRKEDSKVKLKDIERLKMTSREILEARDKSTI